MLNIVLFGAPGCGKGTQAARLKERYGITPVAPGVGRGGESARGPELAKHLERASRRAQLPPDRLVIDIIAHYVEEHRDCAGNIFDGFPRTTAQAEAFDEILGRHGLKVDLMVYMDVPEEELVKRILLRGKDSGRADDASEEVIRNRISTYRAQTAVVADYYAAAGKYVAVNGVGTMDEVFERICTAIDNRA